LLSRFFISVSCTSSGQRGLLVRLRITA
jgi:hypothetical protein